ncbi:MAG: hypothetical protein NVS9B4_05260 [Candidatus Acidiferrum sp.]
MYFTAALLTMSVWAGSSTAGQADKEKKRSKKTTATTETKAATGTTVDLNTASEKELDDLPGVGPATAKKIIAGRPYSAVSDLSKAGVSARTIKEITPLVTVSAAMPKGGAKPATTATENNTPTASPSASETSGKATPAKNTSASTVAQGNPGPGMVWVNTETKVYHRQGDRWYGKTKQGKYMTEDEATKAGYRAAKK